MLNLLRKTAQVTYVPAIPGQSYRAAYCYKTWVPRGRDAVAPSTQLVCTYYPPPPGFGNGVDGYTSYVCKYVTTPGSPAEGYWRETCVPAVPYIAAIPGVVLADQVVGWNAGARSIYPLPLVGHGQVRVPADIAGAVVGLSDGAGVHTYGHATHAFVVQGGQVQVIESGETKFEYGAAPALGTYRVMEVPGGVGYFVDNVLVYRSPTPSYGQKFLDATLYVTEDAVWDPVIGDVVVRSVPMLSAPVVTATQDRIVRMLSNALTYFIPTVDGVRRSLVSMTSMPLFRALASITAGRLVQMRSDSVVTFNYARDRIDGRCAPARGLFSTSSAVTIAGSPAAATMHANLGPPLVEYAGINGAFPAALTPMILQSGENLSVAGDAPTPRGLFGLYDADAEVFPGLITLGGSFPAFEYVLRFDPLGANEFDAIEQVLCLGWMRPDAVVFLTVYDGIGVSTQATLTIIIDVGGYDAVAINDELTMSRVIQLVGNSTIRINNSAGYIAALLSQYATNSSSGAITRYEGFGFAGFTHGGGESYGWRKDGVYRIGGETDDGKLLRGAIDFGSFDFGSSAMNYLPDAFVGMGTDGTVYMRVTADDGQPVTYRVVGGSVDRRAKLSKGLRGRQWRVQLEVVDAGSAELYDIEFNVELAARRQTRRV